MATLTRQEATGMAQFVGRDFALKLDTQTIKGIRKKPPIAQFKNWWTPLLFFFSVKGGTVISRDTKYE